MIGYLYSILKTCFNRVIIKEIHECDSCGTHQKTESTLEEVLPWQTGHLLCHGLEPSIIKLSTAVPVFLSRYLHLHWTCHCKLFYRAWRPWHPSQNHSCFCDCFISRAGQTLHVRGSLFWEGFLFIMSLWWTFQPRPAGPRCWCEWPCGCSAWLCLWSLCRSADSGILAVLRCLALWHALFSCACTKSAWCAPCSHRGRTSSCSLRCGPPRDWKRNVFMKRPFLSSNGNMRC